MYFFLSFYLFSAQSRNSAGGTSKERVLEQIVLIRERYLLDFRLLFYFFPSIFQLIVLFSCVIILLFFHFYSALSLLFTLWFPNNYLPWNMIDKCYIISSMCGSFIYFTNIRCTLARHELLIFMSEICSNMYFSLPLLELLRWCFNRVEEFRQRTYVWIMEVDYWVSSVSHTDNYVDE